MNGIGFTLWAPGKQKHNPILTISELDTDKFQVKQVGSKTVYSADGNAASEWVKDGISALKTMDAPQLQNAVNVKQRGFGSIATGALGFFFNTSNNVYQNSSFVSLLSSAFSHGHGFSIMPANFRRVVALFTARKTIKPDWINCKDEYLVPHAADKSSPLNDAYEVWNSDAIVYSLFNTSSQQSSLRDIKYKGKVWQIKNHFFFMSAKEMQALADKSGFQEMYQDARAYGDDSFVFKQLASTTLSDDAKAVLEAARSLVRSSMAMRKIWHSDHPEHHLQAWDQGWAAMKPMFKACHKGLYDQFVTTYKSFERRMQKGVYEYGFLR